MSHASLLAKVCCFSGLSWQRKRAKTSADFKWRCVFFVGSSEKEVAQAFVQLPREFPVYLWQPFARHSYYCFPEPEAQRQFSAVLGDCVRHSNHGECRRGLFLYVIHPGEDLNSYYSRKAAEKCKSLMKDAWLSVP